MLKVKNRGFIRHIALQRMKADAGRNRILTLAIALTTVLLTSVFTIAGSALNSIQQNTMYQVGTYNHAGFKFLSQEQYDLLAADSQVKDLSYNITLGYANNQELEADYTEVRYATEENAISSFNEVSVGHMPEKMDEVALPTSVLDDYGLPHELGVKIPLAIIDGVEESPYIQTEMTVVGFWEKASVTMANEIYVSKEFQEKYAPVWQNQQDIEDALDNNRIGGSINPSFDFPSKLNLDGQMAQLKDRLGFDASVNEGVNWAYFTQNLDFTFVATCISTLAMIILSGYLIIYNILLISVSSDVRFYGLLKTIGMTARQQKKIVYTQAFSLSLIGIPLGITGGYLLSYLLLPVIVRSLATFDIQISVKPVIFILSAAFALFTVWISCRKPCKLIRKITPVEAVRYVERDLPAKDSRKQKKTKQVSPAGMAFANVMRNKKKTMAVVLSMALSLILLNVTISIVTGFDEDKYIKNFAVSDFTVADASVYNVTSLDINLNGISQEDVEYLSYTPGITQAGIVFMTESIQKLGGEALSRLQKFYEAEDISSRERAFFDQEIYENQTISSHIYGVDEYVYQRMEMNTPLPDWSEFDSGKYAIVTAFYADGRGEIYKIGEDIAVTLPDGSEKNYQVAGIGDISYAFGPQHGHGIDIYITLPEGEYNNILQGQGALRYAFDVETGMETEAEQYVSEYCERAENTLGHNSKEVFSRQFHDLTETFLIVGGVLSFMLALIALLNFTNLTVTSIQERRVEIAIIQSVGMTGKQLKKMLIWEGIYKILITCGFLYTFGLLIDVGIVKLMITDMWMCSFRFMLWPMSMGAVFMILPAVLIPYICYKNMEHMTLVERLRQVE